jgi:hypothetical protein
MATHFVYVRAASGAGHSQFEGASAVDMAFVRAAPSWDLDHDGIITCDEWKQYAGTLFTQFDSGSTGYLTPTEFAAMAKPTAC